MKLLKKWAMSGSLDDIRFHLELQFHPTTDFNLSI